MLWIWGVVLLGVAGFCGYTAHGSRKSIQRMTETVTAGSEQLVSTRTEEQLGDEHGTRGALFTIGGAVSAVAGIVVLVVSLVQSVA